MWIGSRVYGLGPRAVGWLQAGQKNQLYILQCYGIQGGLVLCLNREVTLL